MTPVSEIRLAVTCPSCGTHPRIRTFPDVRELFNGGDPERVIMTYDCHGRLETGKRCGTRYVIRARHFYLAA